MMAVDAKNRVMLVRQYRLPANQFLWELPAGKTDDGETVQQAAKRELIEETGLRAKKWKKLVTFFPSPGYDGQVYHLIAHDPWMRRGSAEAIVYPTFRYQRILVPALAWMLNATLGICRGGQTSSCASVASPFLWMATSGTAGASRLGGTSCPRSGI